MSWLGGTAEAMPFPRTEILGWEPLGERATPSPQDDNLVYRLPPFRTGRGKMGHPFGGYLDLLVGSWLHERGRSRLHCGRSRLHLCPEFRQRLRAKSVVSVLI